MCTNIVRRRRKEKKKKTEKKKEKEKEKMKKKNIFVFAVTIASRIRNMEYFERKKDEIRCHLSEYKTIFTQSAFYVNLYRTVIGPSG